MKPIPVTAKLAVAPQPKLEDFQEFRWQGFTTIVNNRPDGEDPAQPGSAAEAEAARAAGLGYVHIPVTTMGMTEQDARLLKETSRAGARPRRRALPERCALLLSLGSVRGSRFAF